MAYHSAYRGIVKTPNGDFDHFVRQLDTSHIIGGHWRFQSTEDDRRAMAQGFTTPEDLLCAVDSNQHEDEYDNIIIRWVRGANDTNVRMALSGTATEHLQTIYELRALLGLPMSSRGQIPLYPISTDPILKRYWDVKYGHRQFMSIASTGQLPDRPIASPLTPGPSHSSSAHPQHVSIPEQAPLKGLSTSSRSAKISKGAQPNPVNNATPLQQPLGATVTHTSQPLAAGPLSGGTAHPSPPTNTIGQQQALSLNIASPASASIPPASSGSRNVPSIPRAALAWGLESYQSPTLSRQSHGVSQHNWVHSSSSGSASPQQQQERNGVTHLSHDTSPTSPGAITASNIPYRSPYPAITPRDSLRHASPAVVPSVSSLNGGHIQNHIVAPHNATTPAVSTISSSAANSLSSSVAASTALSASSNNASEIIAQTSPSVPRSTIPTTPTRKSPEPFLDNMSSPVAPQPSSPPPNITGLPIGQLFATDKTSRGAPRRPTPLGRGNKRPYENDLGLQRKLDLLDIHPPGTEDTGAGAKAAGATPDPWYAYAKGLEEIPCMDCGEVSTHGLDCHIGGINMTQSPTILEYRSLADAVELFDPGPWTTHFNPIEPEPEDADTQIRGMAKVIRNEDSYNDDEELHDLPDELMILLWAFKTSKGVQVINEDDWDSGIGEPAVE